MVLDDLPSTILEIIEMRNTITFKKVIIITLITTCFFKRQLHTRIILSHSIRVNWECKHSTSLPRDGGMGLSFRNQQISH